MITTILKKSTSINYFLVGVLMFSMFFIYQFSLNRDVFSVLPLLEKLTLFLFLFSSICLSDFITKKNELSKNSGFSIFFSFFFFLYFPEVLNNFSLILSNFFILIAVRRLISMNNPVETKQKIFDASLWIFIASIFHFWSILFLILVFVSILLSSNRDYRNWFLPLIGFFTVAIIYVFFSALIDKSLIAKYLNNSYFDFTIDYFKNIYQNLMFSIFVTTALFFIICFILALLQNSKIMTASYQKLLVWVLIAVAVFAISAQKSNAVLIFTFAPLAIISTDFLESNIVDWQKEIVFLAVFFISLFGFFSQL
jgi:Family of unknown function (DUF6427)